MGWGTQEICDEDERRCAGRMAELDRAIAAGPPEKHAVQQAINEPIRIFRSRTVAINPVLSDQDKVISYIIGTTADAFGISIASIHERRHLAEIVQPRQAAMWVIRQILGLPPRRIGMQFGGYDNMTVIRAIEVVAERRRSNPDYCRAIDALLEKCRSRAGAKYTTEKEKGE